MAIDRNSNSTRLNQSSDQCNEGSPTANQNLDLLSGQFASKTEETNLSALKASRSSNANHFKIYPRLGCVLG